MTEAEQREKNRITLMSVAAALVLTTLKLVVGLLTGSLGLISEAAHSGLDMVASVLTFFSVRIAGRPADADHPYGHERMENLSALIQGVMLLGTASWIIYESVRRIAFVTVEVETSPWTFAVMGGSILIDLWRSTTALTGRPQVPQSGAGSRRAQLPRRHVQCQRGDPRPRAHGVRRVDPA